MKGPWAVIPAIAGLLVYVNICKFAGSYIAHLHESSQGAEGMARTIPGMTRYSFSVPGG